MDAELVRSRLAFVMTCVRELRELANPDALATDVRERRFVEHTLQLAIQAALDVASHFVAARRLGEPTTNRALFELLLDAGLLQPQLATQLGDMAGFRNVLVHGYVAVDLRIVRDILDHHLEDLEEFARCMDLALLSVPSR